MKVITLGTAACMRFQFHFLPIYAPVPKRTEQLSGASLAASALSMALHDYLSAILSGLLKEDEEFTVYSCTRYKSSYFFKAMFNFIEKLPIELVGTNVLGFLYIWDIVMLERASSSKESHQLFLNLMLHSPAVELPPSRHMDTSTLDWFVKRQCKLSFLNITLPGDNPGLHVKNLRVAYFVVNLCFDTTMESYSSLELNESTGYNIKTINIKAFHSTEVMEHLSTYTSNVKNLIISKSYFYIDWLTVDILKRWKLQEIDLKGEAITTELVQLIAQTCSTLTSIKIFSNNIDDAAMIAISQHCPKLKQFTIFSNHITFVSLLTLSEKGLPLEKLQMSYIPDIPTADIARRCSYALTRICYLLSWSLGNENAYLYMPYLSEVTSMQVDSRSQSFIPLLAQYFMKLTKIVVVVRRLFNNVVDILPLCLANPLLQYLNFSNRCDITDTILIEVIHACPHLQILWLPDEVAITDTSILALSEHCTQLQELNVCMSKQITEVAVLQLLQHCRKLTTLVVSSSSLSEETWTQLDSNAQKRVNRS